MGKSDRNLLARLHRWAWRQDENFLTEALAYLLSWLLRDQPTAGVALLQFLTGGRIDVATASAKLVDVTTQEATSLGRPDIVIRAPSVLIYVEANVESGVGPDQIGRYRRQLVASGESAAVLVLLSRYPLDAVSALGADVRLRWFLVAEWLGSRLKPRTGGPEIRHPVGRFLIREFIGLLRSRGMTMNSVRWELGPGVRSLRSLVSMLGEALNAVPLQKKRYGGWDSIGWFLGPDTKYWVGLEYDKPTELEFRTRKMQVDVKAFQDLGFGDLRKSTWVPGGKRWVYTLDLESEAVHFFACSLARQRQVIEEFLAKALDVAQRIEGNLPPPVGPANPGTPPVP